MYIKEKERVQLVVTMLWEYTLKIEQRYINEIIQLENAMLVHGADDLDYLNMIQANARLQAVRDVCNDVQEILFYGKENEHEKEKICTKGK